MANRYVQDDIVELFEVLLEEAGWSLPEKRPVTVTDHCSRAVSYYSWLWSQVTTLPEKLQASLARHLGAKKMWYLRRKRCQRNLCLKIQEPLAVNAWRFKVSESTKVEYTPVTFAYADGTLHHIWNPKL